MYRYDEFDAAFVRERTAQFRDQVSRRLAGEINEDQFRPLRLMNGLYLQLHAYMLRIAVPYGTLASRQLGDLTCISTTNMTRPWSMPASPSFATRPSAASPAS